MNAYTDLEQSKKLAKILQPESADMWWREVSYGFYHIEAEIPKGWYDMPPKGIPCWSLAALLDILNYPTLIHEFCGSEKEKWFLTIKDPEETYRVWENDPIDACYEMILKLHEHNLL